MIELFYASTPNGRKISIMLEEIKFEYKITEINLSKGDQFNSDFRKISPLSKIPAITDHKNKISVSQSGAILRFSWNPVFRDFVPLHNKWSSS